MRAKKTRLKEALELRGWTVYKLHKTLVNQSVRGSSYSSIRNYLGLTDKPSDPPLEFLLAAAEALEVNPDYLAYGKDHLTAAHSASAGAGEVAQPDLEDWGPRLALDLKEAVLAEMGVVEEPLEEKLGSVIDLYDGLDLDPAVLERVKRATVRQRIPYWVAPLGEVWQKLLREHSEITGEYPQGQIARALAGPLEALGVDGGQMHKSELFGHYILAMAPSLLILSRALKLQEMVRDPILRSNPEDEEAQSDV
jgi:hypothetical protein